MTWDRRGPTAPKYRSGEHRRARTALVKQLKRDGFLMCQAVVCVMPSRVITNPNGRQRDGLHLGHNDDGVTYRGAEHMACNVRDGSRRGNAKKSGAGTRVARWIV